MNGLKNSAILLLLAFLTGCSAMKISDFEGTEPKLVLEEFFQGRTEASGIFHDRFGDIRRQFVVSIQGTVDGDRLTLVEDFVYDDGETEQRIWTLTRTGPSTYEGTAPGVVGIAKGRIAGNAFQWKYTFDLKMKDRTVRVDFDDWMFLQPNGVVLNRATVSKWGIELGTAIISFHPVGNAENAEMAAHRHAAE